MKKVLLLISSLGLFILRTNAQSYIENQFSGPQASSSLWISDIAKIGADWTGTKGAITLRCGDIINAGYLEFIRPGGVRKGYIGYGDDNTIQYSAENGAHHAFINGNVGIGANNPANKLEVSGSVALYDGNFFKVISNQGTNWSNTNLIGHSWAGQDYTSILVPGGTPNSAEIRLLANGNVGIGTVNPQSALAVNGTVTATKVKVTQTGWSDFVFQPEYKLPSLSEVEAFIKENKHLPDIPSEKEVKANGIDVGESHAKLLQKIEELTLYLIDINKKVEAQSQLILNQQQLISEQGKALKENRAR